jgi:TPR repeat protein
LSALNTGKDVKQDDFKALKFYQKACDLNDGTGCFNLGVMYLSALKLSCLTPLPSLYINPRSEQPVPLFKSHAMYEKGKGVKQDDFKALKFYQKACDLNLGISCSQLNYLV